MFQKLPNIQSGRLSLTPIQESDLEDLWRIYSNPVHFRWTPDTSTKNKETLRKRIGHFQRDFDKKKRLFLALRLDGKLIGVLEAFDYKKRSASATIGYRLHEDVWNQGLASEALSLFCHYLTTACQLQTIHAFVLPENQASQKVLEKNDFRLQGHVTENWKGHGEVTLLHFSLNHPSSSKKQGLNTCEIS
jgi:ribosomal-protein-alanine N-acetyltransferase